MNRYKYLFIGLALLILCSSFCFPEAVAYVEDLSLLKKAESYQIEEVNLTPDSSTLYEKLEIGSQLYFQNIMYIDSGEKITSSQAEQIVNNYLNMLSGAAVTNLKFINTVPFVCPSLDMKELYLFWECHVIDEKGYRYFFVLDDDTGKIISFVAPCQIVTEYMKNGLDALTKQMADYYGIEMDVMAFPFYEWKELLYYNIYPEFYEKSEEYSFDKSLK